jgi:hypothetical protein
MGLLDAYSDRLEQAFQRDLRNPGAAPPPESFSTWSFLAAGGKAPVTGGLEAHGSLLDALSGFGATLASTGGSAGGMFSTESDAEKQQAEQARQRVIKGQAMDTRLGNELRRKADEFAPDPATSHTADRVVHGLVRGVSKAVGETMLLGPVAGPVAFGLDEGNTTTQRLRTQGVDDKTAAKVGAVTGVVSGVTAGIPGVGSTVRSTIGLAAGTGPGAYILQEQLTKDILQKAKYPELAAQHDPLDPLGLALSVAVPGALGGLHIRSLQKRGAAIEAGGVPLDQMSQTERRSLKYNAPQLDAYAAQAAEREGVPAAILLGIKNAGEKSGSGDTSPKGAQGVMQFMPGTAKELGITDRTDPAQSIDGAARYLRQLYDAYGSWDAAVAHYNGGGAQAAIVRGGGKPTFPETAAYLERVKKYAQEHTAQRGASDPDVVAAARVQVLDQALMQSMPAHPEARSEVLAAADELAAGRVPHLAAPPEPITFTTARGSTYEVGEGGVTTRNKAARSDVGHEGDAGPQPTSRATYYLTPEQAQALAEIQTKGRAPAQIAEMPDGRIGMRYTDGPDAGKFEARTVVTPQREPSVGMTPVELWDGGKTVHFGNEITQVNRPAPRAPVERIVDSANAIPDQHSIEIEPSPPKIDTAALAPRPFPDAEAAAAPDKAAPGEPSARGEGGSAPAGEAPSLDAQRTAALAQEKPDLQVVLPGSDEKLSLKEALAKAKEEADMERSDADLLRAAAECALSFGF